MKIMIDIDNDLYTRLFDAGENYVMDMRRACAAVRKGVVIPDGHGRLIDADKLYPDSDYEDGLFHAVSIGQIGGAETIAEAESEG